MLKRQGIVVIEHCKRKGDSKQAGEKKKGALGGKEQSKGKGCVRKEPGEGGEEGRSVSPVCSSPGLVCPAAGVVRSVPG